MSTDDWADRFFGNLPPPTFFEQDGISVLTGALRESLSGLGGFLMETRPGGNRTTLQERLFGSVWIPSGGPACLPRIRQPTGTRGASRQRV